MREFEEAVTTILHALPRESSTPSFRELPDEAEVLAESFLARGEVRLQNSGMRRIKRLSRREVQGLLPRDPSILHIRTQAS